MSTAPAPLPLRLLNTAAGYRAGLLVPYLPRLSGSLAGPADIEEVVARWRSLYRSLRPLPPEATQPSSPEVDEAPATGGERSSKSDPARGDGDDDDDEDEYKDVGSPNDDDSPLGILVQEDWLEALLVDLRRHNTLRYPWRLCRHLLSMALILRLAERFMDHLTENYMHSAYWSGVAAAVLPAFKLFKKVESPPLGLSATCKDVRSVYEHDVKTFYKQRMCLLLALRERDAPPFTLLRLCELVSPKNTEWRFNFWKWCMALQKIIIDPASSYNVDIDEEALPSGFSDPEINHLCNIVESNYEYDNPIFLENCTFL